MSGVTIGKFKKPDIGMFIVMKDIIIEKFGKKFHKSNTVMIGDTWHDEKAAKNFDIDFIKAQDIHAAFRIG